MYNEKKIKEKKCLIFFLEIFFLTILNTAVLGSEIVSPATCAIVDESLVSNQYGYLGGDHYRKSVQKKSLKEGFELRQGDHLTHKALGQHGDCENESKGRVNRR